MTIPEMKYQPMVRRGPSQPTNSESLRENRMMSRTGLEKFRYKLARLVAHLSKS